MEFRATLSFQPQFNEYTMTSIEFFRQYITVNIKDTRIKLNQEGNCTNGEERLNHISYLDVVIFVETSSCAVPVALNVALVGDKNRNLTVYCSLQCVIVSVCFIVLLQLVTYFDISLDS